MGGKSLASPRRNRRVVAAGASRGRGPLAGRRGSTCARVSGALHGAGPRRVAGRRRVPPVGPGSGCGRWRPAGARRRPCRWPPLSSTPSAPSPRGAGCGRASPGAGRGRGSRSRGSRAGVAAAARGRGSRAGVAGVGRGRGSRSRGSRAGAQTIASHCIGMVPGHRAPYRTSTNCCTDYTALLFPPFPPILILIAWRTALGPPRGSRQNVAPPSCFDRPGPNPILRSGGGGGTNVGKENDAPVGKSAGR